MLGFGVSKRDAAIAELRDKTIAGAARLARLERDLAEVRAQVEAMDEPRRRLSVLGNECMMTRGSVADTERELRERIKTLAPAALVEAVRLIQKRRQNEDPTHLDPTLQALEELYYEPGDVRPRIKQILTRLAQQEADRAVAAAERLVEISDPAEAPAQAARPRRAVSAEHAHQHNVLGGSE